MPDDNAAVREEGRNVSYNFKQYWVSSLHNFVHSNLNGRKFIN